MWDGKKFENFGCFEYLELHLQITTLRQVVIFYEITGFLRAVFRRLSQWITSYTLKVSMYNDPQKEGKPER